MDPEAIVRGLAACDPVMVDRGHGTPTCTLCRQRPEVEGDPVLHLDDCPWQLSRDWVDEHDTPLN